MDKIAVIAAISLVCFFRFLLHKYEWAKSTNLVIDLLVIVADSQERRHHRARQAYMCLRGLTAPTEVSALTRREIAQAATVPTSVVHQALQHGRVLYSSLGDSCTMPLSPERM